MEDRKLITFIACLLLCVVAWTLIVLWFLDFAAHWTDLVAGGVLGFVGGYLLGRYDEERKRDESISPPPGC